MKRKNHNIYENELHPFHLVKPSPWPMLVSFGLFFILLGFVDLMSDLSEIKSTVLHAWFLVYFVFMLEHCWNRWENKIEEEVSILPWNNIFICLLILIFLFNWAELETSSNWLQWVAFNIFFVHLGYFGLLLATYFWFRDIIYEATYEGQHTRKVRAGLRLGMKLFIVSEIMFFFSFFFAYFYIAGSPSISIDCLWPPLKIIAINPWALPAVNTALLLSSGITVTWTHRAVVADMRRDSINSLGSTIMLGLIFTYFQYVEYDMASFSITDTVFGSLFYLMTGFHGIHVIVGTVFLIVCWFRLCEYHFNPRVHFGLVAAIWYWHFVDVVWIALYIILYIKPVWSF